MADKKKSARVRVQRRRPDPEKVISGVYYFEHKLTEEIEACRAFLRACSKLARRRRGTEPYFDVTCDIAVAAFVMATKAQSLEEIHDEMIDAMPDEGRSLTNKQLKRVKGFPGFQRVVRGRVVAA